MRAWLGETSFVEFAGTYLHRQPVARSGATHFPSFGWNALGRILEGDPAPDALVVARGELMHVPAPRSLEALRRLMTRGVGLVIRRSERCDTRLAALAQTFTADLAGEAHVQLFATPAGTHGFGWHYDEEHVFVAQMEGIKDYYLRANTVSPSSQEAPDFARFHEERSPLANARLEPGDWLYIPSRWWHAAHCVADALSISIGVRL
jgi:ribosomal protein L16 Arg81 hydroxylase